MTKRDNRVFRVLTVAYLAGILAMLILIHNERPKPTPALIEQPKTDVKQTLQTKSI